ncbi:WapI family immunity protein [Leptospira biflexa]|uniref:WapI family immunity protein n=1 Tax=Leptospira biflexa TaxID=172 RepID=UPI001090E9B4|nr:hypothetical protein [Leptospira biflexa]TGM44225.1 hypothetical protein EHQ88_16550 [Leptospira biflexa]
MIRFVSEQKDQIIRLKGIGYQFPGENDAYYDYNWLLFELEIQVGGMFCKKLDPLFLNFECLEFSKWFLDFPTLPVGSKIFNLENTFYIYKLDEHSNHSKENLRIELDKSILSSQTDSDYLFFDFHISNSDYLEISHCFQEIVNQFPIRSIHKI